MFSADRICLWFLGNVLILLTAASVIAQINRGAIEGRVTGQSGAVVPAVIIQVI